MRTEVHWIDLPGPGRLAVMPRPRGGKWLEGEIVALKDDGVDILISLLTSEEEAYLDLAEEGATARRHGLRFVSHPIWDRGIPEIPGPTWALARELRTQLDAGKTLVAHCRMGIGRSPLILAAILVCGGMEPDAAWVAIGAARGCIVPDTWEQREWLLRTAPPPPSA
jgi:protein-tyrosine phosphatase